MGNIPIFLLFLALSVTSLRSPFAQMTDRDVILHIYNQAVNLANHSTQQESLLNRKIHVVHCPNGLEAHEYIPIEDIKEGRRELRKDGQLESEDLKDGRKQISGVIFLPHRFPVPKDEFGLAYHEDISAVLIDEAVVAIITVYHIRSEKKFLSVQTTRPGLRPVWSLGPAGWQTKSRPKSFALLTDVVKNAAVLPLPSRKEASRDLGGYRRRRFTEYERLAARTVYENLLELANIQKRPEHGYKKISVIKKGQDVKSVEHVKSVDEDLCTVTSEYVSFDELNDNDCIAVLVGEYRPDGVAHITFEWSVWTGRRNEEKFYPPMWRRGVLTKGDMNGRWTLIGEADFLMALGVVQRRDILPLANPESFDDCSTYSDTDFDDSWIHDASISGFSVASKILIFILPLMTTFF